MYRWIVSLLALLGITSMAAQAQNAPQSNHSNLGHIFDKSIKGGGVVGDGTSDP